MPLLCLTVLHLMADAQSSEAHARWLQMANFMAGAIIVFHWTMVLTVAIGCIIVMVMKGPGYVADGYRVSHSDAPREQPESSVEAAYYRKHPSAPHSSEAFDPATNVKNT